jgi:tetratricopeptide (TPR) repeat protein
VFAGGWTLDAAEHVCNADLDVLQSLIDKSLLRHSEDGRFFMLGTIKELALEKVRDLPDASSLPRGHDEHFVAVAEELDARERLSGMRDLSAESLGRFERELPSFRAALVGLLEADRREGVLRLGAALWRFWLNRGQYRDAADWVEVAPLNDATLPSDVRAAALAAAGAIAYYTRDDVDEAERFWREGLDLSRSRDDPYELGAALSRLASIAWRRGDFDGAIAYHKQALPLYEQAGAEALALEQLHWLGDAYMDRGDYEESERVLQETATRAREFGFHQQLTSTLHSLGDLSLDRRDPETALHRFGEALEYAVATASRRVQVYCVAGVACAQLLRGDERAAARLWGIAEDQERRLGFRMLLTERQRYERLMSDARERLGAAYEAEHRAGEGLTLEKAVAEARLHVPA